MEGTEVTESITTKCGSCGNPLKEDGPSLYYCNYSCQERWFKKHYPEPAYTWRDMQ